jgi:hypothetical protein
MRSLLLLAIVAVATLGLVQGAEFLPISAVMEGTAVQLWYFGAATAATQAGGVSYTPAVIVPGTTTTGPDGEIGEIQNLKCGAADCPDVVCASSAFLPAWLPPMASSLLFIIQTSFPQHFTLFAGL